MAVPITQYVLKVHSRCNLACDHCYVYEHADQSWRTRPLAISAEITTMAARRISEHAVAHRIPEVSVVLHGGEPLLLGRPGMRQVLAELTTRIGAVARLNLRMQTNGVLLDERWCDLFREYGVKLGVSVDGDQAANDRHRNFADGRSSYAQVLDALHLLRRPEYQHLYAGILCTIDLANDPIAVYRALAAQEPPNLDLLFPHANWERPPYRPDGQRAPYADWLMRIYWCWHRDGRPMPIRLFDSLLSTARGGSSFTEALGTDPGDVLVIDTNGDWEQPDSMKTAFDGAPSTGMNVFDHPVDAVRAHPGIAARQGGIPVLCATCRACPVVRVCGGGLYAHRFRAGQGPGRRGGVGRAEAGGFDNPSVYCADLTALIDGILVAQHSPVAAVQAAASTGPAERDAARPSHGITDVVLDSLAAGPGDAADVDLLAGVRLSETRALVAAVAVSVVGWRDDGLRTAAAEGWSLLCALSRDHPDAVNEVFAHPYTYAWAIRCLRPRPGDDADLDRAHLASLALAAAFRAGVPAALPSPVRAGYAHLPTVGALAVEPGTGRTEIVTIPPGGPPAARNGSRWLDSRTVTGQPFTRLTVEDLDPFRDCQGWPATERLSSPEWQAWAGDLAVSGRHLAAAVPGYARVLSAGLRAVTPLRRAGGRGRSATARQAFGAVAIARPAPGAPAGELAELLLHEFQHAKLNVLADLRPLVRPDAAVRLQVPWRDDPRPPDGVLHGIYAFLAHLHLRRAEGEASRNAYVRYRSWIHRALTEVGSVRDVLTPDGERFVNGMAEAAEAVIT